MTPISLDLPSHHCYDSQGWTHRGIVITQTSEQTEQKTTTEVAKSSGYSHNKPKSHRIRNMSDLQNAKQWKNTNMKIQNVSQTIQSRTRTNGAIRVGKMQETGKDLNEIMDKQMARYERKTLR